MIKNCTGIHVSIYLPFQSVAVFRNPNTIPFCLTTDLLLNALFSCLHGGIHVKYRYSCHTLLKLEFSGQFFEKCSKNVKFHENASRGSRAVPCGRTDRHEELQYVSSPLSQYWYATTDKTIRPYTTTTSWWVEFPDTIHVFTQWSEHVINHSVILILINVCGWKWLSIHHYTSISNALSANHFRILTHPRSLLVINSVTYTVDSSPVLRIVHLTSS
jgi:hypothetical protein